MTIQPSATESERAARQPVAALERSPENLARRLHLHLDCCIMGITEIIKEVDSLEPVDRKRLMSHLVLSRLKENESYREELARRLDDKDPDNWVSLDDLKKKAGKED